MSVALLHILAMTGQGAVLVLSEVPTSVPVGTAILKTSISC